LSQFEAERRTKLVSSTDLLSSTNCETTPYIALHGGKGELKRISVENLLKRANIARKRHRRDLRRRRMRAGKVARVPPTSGFYPAPRFARRIAPPEHFDFDKDPDGVLGWLNSAFRSSTKVIKASRRKRRQKPGRVRAYHDFAKIKSMTPAAALVVAAYFDRHRHLAGMPIHVYEYETWEPQVRETLAQVGFFDLLGLRAPAIQPAPLHSTKIERFTSQSKLQSEEVGRLIDTLLGYLLAADPGCLSNDEQIARTAKLFAALIEATENTRIHAYPSDTHRGYAVLPNWWLTGSVDPTSRRLTLIVYDQGISMPGSLASFRNSRWPGHELVNKIIKRFSRGSFDPDDTITDHAKIRLAMKMGVSSTGEAHRGKGLPVVREAIDHCRRGRLHILSRNGGYVEETGKRAFSWPLTSPMIGTLIVWDLWL
jgi:hypothetical protein